jgi:16S rRNA (cytidine1402-2'-O)-methyltransferase
MPTGTLFVVSTPIGNLEDITFRAVRTLREVTLIAAEDTRRTARLLASYEIRTRSVSFHSHNTRRRLPHLLSLLHEGHSIALVSDAGTPGISDPGTELVRTCWEQGIPVDGIPGASAPLAAAACAGFPLEPMTFLGFPPSRGKDRISFFESLGARSETLVLFESPHRIEACLASIDLIMPVRVMLLARELTKVHQQLIRGSASEIRSRLSTTKGEFTLVLGPTSAISKSSDGQRGKRSLLDEFAHMTNNSSLSRREIIRILARTHGLPSKEVYRSVQQDRKSID